MKKIALLTLLLAATALGSEAKTRADEIVDEINNPRSEKVLVAVHRGDWRNHPENSLEAIEGAIAMGADIVEIDLALTKDSVLVLCHDRNVDRTATGSGMVSDLTLEQIKNMRLRIGHQGSHTELQMPTLKEAMEVCRDRIVINIDKGYQYYDLVQKLSEEMGMTGQLLIKGGIPSDDVKEKFAQYEHNMIFMPIINPTNEHGQTLAKEYLSDGNLPPAIEVCWGYPSKDVDDLMKEMREKGVKIWVNTLWNSLCGGDEGGFSDDRAYYGSADEIYGKLLDMGVTMIQTDRPQFLIDYLRGKGRHE